MKQNLSVFGSTGSIGTQTLAVARELGLTISAITARTQLELCEAQAREFSPRLVCVSESGYRDMKTRLADTDIEVVAGTEGLLRAATLPEAETVVTGISGSAGLRPTLAAIDAGKRIALANKETLVCAGSLVMARAKARGAEIVPVDSEHSAIFQCLTGRSKEELRQILLTASGGPFRGKNREETYGMTPDEALKHPSWSMGAKVTIDSATMMNKGLEVIEAMHLFGVSVSQIRVVVHPQSIIHSMVALRDGTVIAQLGLADMRLPIRYAITYPERPAGEMPAPDFAQLATLQFFDPDLEAFPCLALAILCANKGGNAPAVMNAANEAAVSLFLQGKIRFGEIFEWVNAAVESIDFMEAPDLEDLEASDCAAREWVLKSV